MGDRQPVVCFVSASGQNIFFAELLAVLRAALESAGVETREATDHFPALEENLVYVVVAHEYFVLTEPAAHPTEDELRRTIAIETEQPGTTWFDEAATVAARCALTVDINRLGVRALRARGIDARFIQLGYVSEWDHWHEDSDADRPIDVSFMGGHTPRRAIALGRCADVLADRRAALHLTETGRPHTEASTHFLAGARRWAELSRTKVMVNIHRSEIGYFEWQRIVGAIANGCIVLTEHSAGYHPLVPGRHFVSTAHENVHLALETLLDDPERLERIRHEAYGMLRDELPLERSIGALRDAAADVLEAAPLAELEQRRRASRPAPRELPPPLIEHDRVLSDRDEIAQLRTGVKHLLIEQRELRRELTGVTLPTMRRR